MIGEVNLFENSNRKKPLIKEWWGHANLKGENRKDSYYIYLIDKDEMNFGERANAEFKFKFSDDERFKIKIKEGQILELSSGERKMGEFIIQKIVNKRLK